MLLVAGCAAQQQEPPLSFSYLPVPAGAQEATVVRHSDGDTIVLRGRGTGPLPAQPTKVRLLLIDTPEVHGVPECAGPEAAARLVELIPKGALVRVQSDQRALDRFGRMLLHVWDSKGTHLGQELLAEGHARVLVVRPNVLYLDELRAAEAVGRFMGRNAWACPAPPAQ